MAGAKLGSEKFELVVEYGRVGLHLFVEAHFATSERIHAVNVEERVERWLGLRFKPSTQAAGHPRSISAWAVA
eukprot:3472158-Prymnesium_polylepis.1